jgi:hypothetical protein
VTPHKDSPYRLIVEGQDDQHSIIHLMARHGYEWDRDDFVRPFVHPAGNWQRALAGIGVAAKSYERVGLVVDADHDVAARWHAVSDRLSAVGYDVPKEPPVDGLIVTHQHLAKFGVWLMPDDRAAGALEDFLQELVSHEDATWPIACDATQRAIDGGANLRQGDQLKGTLHSWLAWQDPPGMAFGTALKALVFAHESATASRFAAWFRTLF